MLDKSVVSAEDHLLGSVSEVDWLLSGPKQAMFCYAMSDQRGVVGRGRGTYTMARAVTRRIITAERTNFRVMCFGVASLHRSLILCLRDAY